jgi:hypothetical protein
MNGGRIINNNISGTGDGGGVYCDGSIKMTGGKISDNQAPRGGGIYNDNYGDSVISGGAISGNKTEFVGGGIYVDSGVTYTATGGSVTGNTAGDDVGHNVFTK